MNKKKRERPVQQPDPKKIQAAKLPLALFRYVTALEDKKNGLLGQVGALEELQKTRIQGYFDAIGLGDFIPNQWDIGAEGMMKRLHRQEPPAPPPAPSEIAKLEKPAKSTKPAVATG